MLTDGNNGRASGGQFGPVPKRASGANGLQAHLRAEALAASREGERVLYRFAQGSTEFQTVTEALAELRAVQAELARDDELTDDLLAIYRETVLTAQLLLETVMRGR